MSDNISRLLDLGVIGINFEYRIVKGAGLYDLKRQASRVTVIRKAAEQQRVTLFINARTDLFLAQGRDTAQSLSEALDRAKAYAAAGASGFFIPGLRDDALIGRVCNGVALPVNVMVMDGVPSNDRLTELGVSRISYGSHPVHPRDGRAPTGRKEGAFLVEKGEPWAVGNRPSPEQWH